MALARKGGCCWRLHGEAFRLYRQDGVAQVGKVEVATKICRPSVLDRHCQPQLLKPYSFDSAGRRSVRHNRLFCWYVLMFRDSALLPDVVVTRLCYYQLTTN